MNKHQVRSIQWSTSSQWIFVVNDLEAGLTENEIVEKYKDRVNRTTVQMIKRILQNQLY